MSSPSGKRHLILFAIVVLAGLALDLATKHYAFAQLGHPLENGGREAWVIKGFFGFQTSLNEGALFGLGQGYRWLFICLSFVALLGIGCWVALGEAGKQKLLAVTLAMITAGIFGNLYDRLGLPAMEGDWTWPVELLNADGTTRHQQGDPIHAVRDFILFRFGTRTWPNFNIADSLLMCGVGLMLLHAYVLEPRQRKRESASEVSSTSEPVADKSIK